MLHTKTDEPTVAAAMKLLLFLAMAFEVLYKVTVNFSSKACFIFLAMAFEILYNVTVNNLFFVVAPSARIS